MKTHVVLFQPVVGLLYGNEAWTSVRGNTRDPEHHILNLFARIKPFTEQDRVKPFTEQDRVKNEIIWNELGVEPTSN